VLHPDHGRAGGAGGGEERLDIGDHGIALVGGANHADLHVDDEEGGRCSVRQCAHRRGSLAICGGPGPVGVARAMQAMIGMNRLVVAELTAAYEGK